LVIELPGVVGPQVRSQYGYRPHALNLVVCHDKPDSIWAYGGYRIDLTKHTATEVKGFKGSPQGIACSTDPNKIYILEGKMGGGFIQPNLAWLIERDIRTMKETDARPLEKCYEKIPRMDPTPGSREMRSLYSSPFQAGLVVIGFENSTHYWPLNQSCPNISGYGGESDNSLAAIFFLPRMSGILRWINPGTTSDDPPILRLSWKNNMGELSYKNYTTPGSIINAVSTLGDTVAVATDVGLYYTPDIKKPFVKISDEVGDAVLLTPKGTVIFGNEKGTLKKFALPKQ
jgi:hypothetical protein